MTRRTPDQYDWATCSFDETILPASPRRITSPRRQPIRFVVVHHMAMAGTGDAALDACKRAWATREASAHYGVAADKNGVGHVRQYVWDRDEAWATANSQGNQAGISIEHANSAGAPGWEVSEATWRTGAKLVAALHRLYGLGRPVDGVTKDHRVVSGTLFKHSDFYPTACCGPYLGGKIWAKYVAEAQHQYDLLGDPEPQPEPANTLPAQVLDLRNFKLTLPTGSKGKPTEVKQPALAGYEDLNFYTDDPGDGVVFRAPCGGVTTSGSGYPRSELREMSGSKLAAWSSKVGVHQMSLTQAITHLPVRKPHVVAGQIHDASDDVVMIRLEGKRLFVEAGGDEVGLLDADYRLGTTFKVTIQASKSGITVYYAKTPTASRVKVKVPVTGVGWYFKAGCYTQSNTAKGDAATAYGEVVIRELVVSHK